MESVWIWLCLTSALVVGQPGIPEYDMCVDTHMVRNGRFILHTQETKYDKDIYREKCWCLMKHRGLITVHSLNITMAVTRKHCDEMLNITTTKLPDDDTKKHAFHRCSHNKTVVQVNEQAIYIPDTFSDIYVVYQWTNNQTLSRRGTVRLRFDSYDHVDITCNTNRTLLPPPQTATTSLPIQGRSNRNQSKHSTPMPPSPPSKTDVKRVTKNPPIHNEHGQSVEKTEKGIGPLVAVPIAVAIVVITALVVLILLFCHKRKKKHSESSEPSMAWNNSLYMVVDATTQNGHTVHSQTTTADNVTGAMALASYDNTVYEELPETKQKLDEEDFVQAEMSEPDDQTTRDDKVLHKKD